MLPALATLAILLLLVLLPQAGRDQHLRMARRSGQAAYNRDVTTFPEEDACTSHFRQIAFSGSNAHTCQQRKVTMLQLCCLSC